MFVPGSTWKVTWPVPGSTGVFGPNEPVFPACATNTTARSVLDGSLI